MKQITGTRSTTNSGLLLLLLSGVVGGAIVMFASVSCKKKKRRQRRTVNKDEQDTNNDNDDDDNNKNRNDCSINNKHDNNNKNAYEKLIGNTPMIQLNKLSTILQRQIYVKMECYNPSGTGKDRAAYNMIYMAELSGQLPKSNLLLSLVDKDATISNGFSSPAENNNNIDDKSNNMKKEKMERQILIQKAIQQSRTGGIVIEGTSGSTGIAVAYLCNALGHGCIVVMPDDQAIEKQVLLKALNCIVHVVPTASISNPNHYVNIAQQITNQINNNKYNIIINNNNSSSTSRSIQAVFLNQFENIANFYVHYEQTGPEIYQQCQGNIDAFVMSAGTGGTVAGVGRYLKEKCKRDNIKIVLVDPPGSSMYNKIMHGIAYTSEQCERGQKRHRYDTIAEGIGLDRVTRNIQMGLQYIDTAIQVTDQHAVDMAHYILQLEGLFIGSSSAMNIVGAIEIAKTLPVDSKIVTIICDSGQRHLTRFWNQQFIETTRGLIWPGNSNSNNNDDDDTTDTIKRRSRRIPECLQDILSTN